MFDFLKRKKIYSYGKQSISWTDIYEVVKVLRSNWLTQGPKTKEFEQELCNYTGAKYSIIIANGSLALQLAVASLDLPPGFKGITTPNTFVATSNSILINGGKVQFADIESATANIDPMEIEKKITDKTKVIIPVHFAGQPCDMQKIFEIAKKYNLYVIEDAAHAIGSEYNGSRIGSSKYSDMTIFSFHPVKTITSGEGGAITTNNKELYERLLQLRMIGINKNFSKNNEVDPWYYEVNYLSTNARMSDLQAALGLSQLKKIDKFLKKRNVIVDFYKSELSKDERFSFLAKRENSKIGYHLCPLLINFDVVKKHKKQIFCELKEQGLFLQVHYIPVHTQPYYQKLGFNVGDFPEAEKYYKKSVSLPLYYDLKKGDLDKIVKIIKEVIA